MNIMRIFGLGSNVILAKDHHAEGTVTKTKKCRWLSVKTKPVRLYSSEHNTCCPSIITFEYRVDDVPYTGKLYIPLRCRVPQIGETISVYYDPENPKNYACYAFGPAVTPIGW